MGSSTAKSGEQGLGTKTQISADWRTQNRAASGMSFSFLSPFFFLRFVYLFVYFWLCWVFITVCGLSLVVAGGGSSLVVVHGLLVAVASQVVEHGL